MPSPEAEALLARLSDMRQAILATEVYDPRSDPELPPSVTAHLTGTEHRANSEDGLTPSNEQIIKARLASMQTAYNHAIDPDRATEHPPHVITRFPWLRQTGMDLGRDINATGSHTTISVQRSMSPIRPTLPVGSGTPEGSSFTVPPEILACMPWLPADSSWTAPTSRQLSEPGTQQIMPNAEVRASTNTNTSSPTSSYPSPAFTRSGPFDESRSASVLQPPSSSQFLPRSDVTSATSPNSASKQPSAASIEDDPRPLFHYGILKGRYLDSDGQLNTLDADQLPSEVVQTLIEQFGKWETDQVPWRNRSHVQSCVRCAVYKKPDVTFHPIDGKNAACQTCCNTKSVCVQLMTRLDVHPPEFHVLALARTFRGSDVGHVSAWILPPRVKKTPHSKWRHYSMQGELLGKGAHHS